MTTTGTVGGGATTPVVYTDPPAPKIEIDDPRPGFVFVHGHWSWMDGQWKWIDGRYEPERAGQVWTDGRWEHRGSSWQWIEGGWADQR